MEEMTFRCGGNCKCLNKQSQVANNGCPPDLALNGGLTCCHCKKLTCYVLSYKGSDSSFGIGTSGGHKI